MFIPERKFSHVNSSVYINVCSFMLLSSFGTPKLIHNNKGSTMHSQSVDKLSHVDWELEIEVLSPNIELCVCALILIISIVYGNVNVSRLYDSNRSEFEDDNYIFII